MFHDTHATSALCPKCSTPMVPGRHAGLSVHNCPKCGGSLASGDCLAALTREAPGYLQPCPAPEENVSHVSACTAGSCLGTFQPYRLNPDLNLTVDICDSCGKVWFDADELCYAGNMHHILKAQQEIDAKFNWQRALFVLFTRVPYELNMRPHREPLIVYALILLNFLVTLAFFAWYPAFNPTYVPAAPKDAVWFASLFSSMFAQANIPHLLSNMYFLYIFGDNLEDLLGRSTFLAFYLGGGLFAALSYTLVTPHPDIPCLGASGAVCAVMGAYMIYFKRARIVLPLPAIWVFRKFRTVKPLFAIGLYIVIDLASALFLDFDGVAHWAHLGGFVFGILFARLTYSGVVNNNYLLKFLNTERI